MDAGAGPTRPRRWWCSSATASDVLLGPVHGRDRCDLGFVDDLLRVQLAARRFGWSIRLREVRADLRELIELAGLTTDLVE